MKSVHDTYGRRQAYITVNQAALIAYLCAMTALGHDLRPDNFVHLCLTALLFGDAAFVSYRNMQNNRALNHFAYLLILLGWSFLLSLFAREPASAALATLSLPICQYQTLYFLQLFVFQAGAYPGQRTAIAILNASWVISTIAYFISPRAFAICYQAQLLLSLIVALIVGILHRKRLRFLIMSQKRALCLSFALVLLPFVCYTYHFYDRAAYMSSMGGYLTVMLTFGSVHSIVFQGGARRWRGAPLHRPEVASLAIGAIAGWVLVARLFHIPFMAGIILLHMAVLLLLMHNLLLYLQMRRQSMDFAVASDRRHFYAYSLAQMEREEALKNEFSNYLHDDVLQDLLSIKNLISKAERADVRALVSDTLDALNQSIRAQMQAYHPTFLKDLTLKENIRLQIESIVESQPDCPCKISLDCDERLFLVEPYDVILYRIITELVTNILKHASAGEGMVRLIQDRGEITLYVTDDGVGPGRFMQHTAGHRGLATIQEQVAQLNGRMSVKANRPRGTQVTITMPMKGEKSYESFIGR